MTGAIFIISHKRPDRVETYHTLRDLGYTGRLYVVVDDMDPYLKEYQSRFCDELLVFNKRNYMLSVDTIISERKQSSAVYARNFVEDEAIALGLDTFVLIDDDITGFRHRWIEDDKIRSKRVSQDFDKVVDFYYEFMYNNDIAEVSMPTSPFFMCGASKLPKKICESRQGYGVHFRNTQHKLEWSSILNEDLISLLLSGKVGNIVLTLPMMCFETPMTDTDEGGINATYKSLSAFERSFLSNIALPSSCSAYATHCTFVLHYDKQKTFPMIISGRYKK